MIESGQVVAVEKDTIWVETEQKTSCGSCAARNGCGQSLLSRIHPDRKNLLQLSLTKTPDALNSGSFAVPSIGDRVDFAVPDNAVLKGASMVYLLPLLGMLAGAIMAAQLNAVELVTIFSSLLGFYAGYKIAAIISGGAYHRQLQPKLIACHPATQHDQTQYLAVH